MKAFLTAPLLLFAPLVLAVALLAAPAGAVEPSEVLDDPALEERARELSKDLRCVVCQNQSIDDSNAELARDLRVLVRERLTAGDSDDEVIDYVVSRYGDFVLLDPPFKGITYALWFGPAVIVGLGVFGLVSYYRRRRPEDEAGGTEAAKPAAKPLTAEEKRRLDALLKETDAS